MASVLPLEVYQELKSAPKLEHTQVRLHAFNGSVVKPYGAALLQTSKPRFGVSVKYFVTDQIRLALLGRNECEQFGPVKRLDGNMPIREILQESDDTQQKIMEEYADVFNGLGMFAGEYEVQLNDSVTPVQEPPRKIPFANMDKLKAAQDQMEANGVIMKETEHTDWVSNLVIMEKKDSNIRVCLDPRSLNKAI